MDNILADIVMKMYAEDYAKYYYGCLIDLHNTLHPDDLICDEEKEKILEELSKDAHWRKT